MSLFKFRFLRNFFRRHTRPIPEDSAVKWKRRLAVTYMLVAWNAFGFVCYEVFNGKADWAKYHGLKSEEELSLSPAQQWARTLGVKKATVYKISGSEITKYDISEDKSEEELA